MVVDSPPAGGGEPLLQSLHAPLRREQAQDAPLRFSPDGAELRARQPGSDAVRPLSECCEAGIYIVDLDMTRIGEPLDWSKIPFAPKPKLPRKGSPRKPVSVALRDGRPAVLGDSRWDTTGFDLRVETIHGPVCVGVVPNERILDAGACFRVLDRARQMNRTPIIWNHWDRLPTDSARLATLMMGRAIECCAPVVISDADGIHELVELAVGFKIPARRVIEAAGEATVDLGYAWGLGNAFKMVTKHVPGRHEGTRIGSLSESQLVVALNVDLAAQPKRAAHCGAFPPIGGKVRPERPGRFGRETRLPPFLLARSGRRVARGGFKHPPQSRSARTRREPAQPASTDRRGCLVSYSQK